MLQGWGGVMRDVVCVCVWGVGVTWECGLSSGRQYRGLEIVKGVEKRQVRGPWGVVLGE